MSEKNYDFRRRLEQIHKPNRRRGDTNLEKDEIEVTDEWKIVIDKKSSALIYNVARDLEDYFNVSMNISLTIIKTYDISSYIDNNEKCIVLATKEEIPKYGYEINTKRSYRFIVKKDYIIVCGNDDRGTSQGSYYIEDVMNMREAPYIKEANIVREPIFQPRMVHSGWGVDRFPDTHLNAIAHSGMDSILIFVCGVDSVPGAYKTLQMDRLFEVYIDFNDLIARASSFGLDVYMYSYLEADMHPDDEGAEEYYDNLYGSIFKACPGFKGVVLVGESCEFPSKDPNTSMVMRKDLQKLEVPSVKPTPGWWPCIDYPQWLNIVKKSVRKYNPEAEIIFWTYNWGWAPEEDRIKLIKSLPKDIIVQATFEMFEIIERDDLKVKCVDYTLSFVGPGKYFESEAKAAHECGLKLHTMCNTAGLTWDIGTIPYEPMPYQWIKRHNALKQAKKDWGLSGLMESHHFGWWPSFVNDIAKWSYWKPEPNIDELCRQIARRDFSEEAIPYVIDAWKLWSEAITFYVPTNEDQYGPLRIGPAYPFIFKQVKNIPTSWYAMFGNTIVWPVYNPVDSTQILNASRVKKEILSFEKMNEYMLDGINKLKIAVEYTPESKRQTGNDMIRLGKFITRCIITTINIKHWWLLKKDIYLVDDIEKINKVIDHMVELAQKEIINAQETIPLVEEDSRLGWEPSMEYVCDKKHIEWKIKQLQNVIDMEIPKFRREINKV